MPRIIVRHRVEAVRGRSRIDATGPRVGWRRVGRARHAGHRVVASGQLFVMAFEAAYNVVSRSPSSPMTMMLGQRSDHEGGSPDSASNGSALSNRSGTSWIAARLD